MLKHALNPLNNFVGLGSAEWQGLYTVFRMCTLGGGREREGGGGAVGGDTRCARLVRAVRSESRRALISLSMAPKRLKLLSVLTEYS